MDFVSGKDFDSHERPPVDEQRSRSLNFASRFYVIHDPRLYPRFISAELGEIETAMFTSKPDRRKKIWLLVGCTSRDILSTSETCLSSSSIRNEKIEFSDKMELI